MICEVFFVYYYMKKTKIKFLKVYEDYKLTSNKKESCDKFGMCRKTFNKYCKQLNLPHDLHIKCRNYNYFNVIDTHDKAYILGFIMADGCISRSKGKNPVLSIKISEKDIDILYYIRDCLKSTHKIVTKNYHGGEIKGRSIKRRKCATFYMRNTELCNDLMNKGVGFRKTNYLRLPKLADEYFHSWLLGFLDGDGYISKRTNRNNIRIGFTCADIVFLEQLQLKIKKLYNIEGKIQDYKSAKELVFYHKNSCILGSYMYSEQKFYLKRKYNKFALYCGDIVEDFSLIAGNS